VFPSLPSSRRGTPAARSRAVRAGVRALAPLALLLAAACAPADDPDGAAATLPPHEAFWANLAAPCGQAFPGGLTLEPPGDEMLEGDELLVVHFDVCDTDEIRLPFHIEQMDGEWDRSRTWIFRRAGADRIELRHDHRTPDGAEDEVTWYGAWTVGPGTANVQEFIIEDRQFEEGIRRGWRIIIEPGERYVYGTIRNGEWTWRVDFDLSEPLEELPPPAWGYEDGGPLR
jgi:hypothetical protein